MQLTQDQFDAIISYIFNVGPGPSHVRPLATAINGGDYAAAEKAIRNGIGDKKRRSVEANGGILTVRDIEHTGCVFTINLPRLVTPALR